MVDRISIFAYICRAWILCATVTSEVSIESTNHRFLFLAWLWIEVFTRVFDLPVSWAGLESCDSERK